MPRILTHNAPVNGAAARATARSTEWVANPVGLLFICGGDCCPPDRPTAHLAPERWEIVRTPAGVVPPFGASPHEPAIAIERVAETSGVALIGACMQRDCRLTDQLLGSASMLADTSLRPWHALAEPARRVRDHAAVPSAQALEILLRQQAVHLATHPAVAAGVAVGRLRIVTWLYDPAANELYFPNAAGEFDRVVAFDPAQNVGLSHAAIRRPRARAVRPVFDPGKLELA